MPALPLDEAGKYVAGAYVVFFTLVVVYVGIIAAKVARIDRELGDLLDLAERDGRETGASGGTGAGGETATGETGAGGGDEGAGAGPEPTRGATDGEPVR